jgi:hypothetical protein
MILARWLLVGILATTAAASGDPPGTVDSSEVVRVTRSGGLNPAAWEAISEAAWITRAETTVVDRVTIRLLSISRGGTQIQGAPAGFGYPMLTSAADPKAPVHDPAIRRALAGGEAVIGELTASIRGAREGDLVRLEGLNGVVLEIAIGAVVPDADLGWSEIWLADQTAQSLGIDRPQAVLLWGDSPSVIAATVGRLSQDQALRISYGVGAHPDPDPVLSVAEVKQRFGEFAVRAGSGDSVQVDPAWRDRFIVSVDLPLVGVTRCNRLVVPYIRGALAEVEGAGLAGALSRDDFQLAGGCWVPRFNRGGDPGYSLSRHAWGTAIDFNPSTNRYGEVPTMPAAIVDIFRRWGFSWGGTWTTPDGMHFEWVRLPLRYTVSCSALTMVRESPSGWNLATRQHGCP